MSDLSGRTLGPYTLIEQLGMGGMATVYKAYQPSMDRTVAVKVLPPHFAQDPTFVGRFLQEAKTIARLEHARILPVYDAGSEDNISYLVMRYLDAGTLQERMQDGPMTFEEAEKVIRQIAEGLDYAHSKGVIHRDVKPANVMLDSIGDVYITDFGIAKLIGGTAQYTGSAMIGTPAYVSPEQGMGQPIDHRSDIYALGIVLYEMVLGRAPFQAETPMAVIIKHINEPLPLPSSIDPNVPQAIESVILRSLAKNPEERYDSCGEMAAALSLALDDIPDHRVKTSLSMATEQLPTSDIVKSAELDRAHRDDPNTLPMSRPIDPDADTGSMEAVLPDDAQKKKRRRWLLIGLPLLCICCIVAFIIVASNDNESVDPDITIDDVDAIASAVVEELFGDDTDEDSDTDQTDPDGNTPGEDTPSDPTEVELFEDISCDDAPLASIVIDPNMPSLPINSEVIPHPEDPDTYILQVNTAQGEFDSVIFGEEVRDSLYIMLAFFQEDSGEITLRSRVHDDSPGYSARFTASGQITLYKGSDAVANLSRDALNDEEAHLFGLYVQGGEINAIVDGEIVLTNTDPNPLGPGQFELEVGDGPMLIGGVLICNDIPGSSDEDRVPPDDLTPIFFEAFDADKLNTEVWSWHNEPLGWQLTDGIFEFPVMEGTGPGYDTDRSDITTLPALLYDLPSNIRESAVVQVKLDFSPQEEGQAAGLFLLNSERKPILSLTRGFCDTADYCQGDAIYYDSWSEGLQNRARYRPQVFAETPPDGFIYLRIILRPNTARAFISLDGEEWKPIGLWPIGPADIQFVGIGTTAGGWDFEGEAPFANFDDFAITQINEGQE